MTLIELKAKVYDLLAQRQLIEQEMQIVNQEIIEMSKPNEVEHKDIPQG